MAKIEIPKISDFQFLGLCDGFAKVISRHYMVRRWLPSILSISVLYVIGRVKNATGLCTKWSMRVLFFIYSRPVHACVHVSIIFMFVCCVLYHILQRFKTAGQL